MAAMSSGTALRNLQQAHAGLKKVRHLLRLARESEGSVDSARVIKAGWEGLAKATGFWPRPPSRPPTTP